MLNYHGWSIWDYIKICIDNGKYINLDLDEIFIKGRPANVVRVNFQHENLIFGYDDIRKEVHLLGSNGGKPKIDIVPLATFQLAYDACYNFECLYLLEYEVDSNAYKLNIKYMCRMLHEYLNGYDSSEGLQGIAPPINTCWGIDLYEEIINSEKISEISSNIPILYILHEHKKCMKERLVFLIARKIFNEHDAFDIINDVAELYNLTQKMMFRALKNNMKKVNNITKLFVQDLNTIKALEIRAYTKLYQLLMHYLKAR